MIGRLSGKDSSPAGRGCKSAIGEFVSSTVMGLRLANSKRGSYVSLIRQRKRNQSSTSASLIGSEYKSSESTTDLDSPTEEFALASNQLSKTTSMPDLGTLSGNDLETVTAWMGHTFPTTLMGPLADDLTATGDPHKSSISNSMNIVPTSSVLGYGEGSRSLAPISQSIEFDTCYGLQGPPTFDMFKADEPMNYASQTTWDALGAQQNNSKSTFDHDVDLSIMDEAWESAATDALTGSSTKSSSAVPSLTKSRTILTMEELDLETRAEIINLLCKRKITTRIEIE